MTQIINEQEEPIINEIKRYSKRFIEKMGGFYPFSIGMNENNEIFSIGAYDGNEYPMSQNLIELLEKSINAEISDNKISLSAICIDIFLNETIDNIKTKKNAIEIRFLSKTYRNTKYLVYDFTRDGKVLFLNIIDKS
jgi:hypothetical protein